MEQQKLHIKYIPLEELKRALRNPKDHDLGTLHESIKRFDFVSPLIINENTGRLLAGHGRLDALQQMKANGTEPPGHVIKINGSWHVPVIYGVNFDSDLEAEAYMLADNRLTELGGWNESELMKSLSDLATEGDEMLRGIGWDANDVDELIRVAKPKYVEQEVPETFEVLVDCDTEVRQVELLNMLEEKGYKCRALMS